MNKKGQIFMARFMMAVAVLMLALGFASPFKETVVNVQGDLDCTNTTITDGTKLLCLGLDTTLWYFILAIMVGGFGILWEKSRSNQ